MRRPHSPRRLPLQPVGADGYQEFTAGAIPIKHALAVPGEPLLLVEHQRGYQLGFDRHLDEVRKRLAPVREVDYRATWAGMTGGPAGPPLVRLDLAIDGLHPRVRLLFKDHLAEALWLLADGAQFGLLLARSSGPVGAAFTPAWVLGPTPVRRDLRRILRLVDVARPRVLSKMVLGRPRIFGTRSWRQRDLTEFEVGGGPDR